MIKLIIAGSRSFEDYELLKTEILKVYSSKLKDLHIVSGGAKGTDKLGERFAKEFGLQVTQFIPDWSDTSVEGAVVKKNRYGEYNAIAGHIRNQKMAEFADALFAFWVDGSSGTKDMILRAQKEKLEINTVLL